MELILIPGFWLDASSWDDVVPALEQAGHNPLPLTLPGMESADADRSTITLRDHVDAVIAVVDAAGSDKVVLVGHSGGGAIAHAVADARPERIARVIYVDAGPLGHGDSINNQIPVVNGDAPLPDWSFFEEPDLIDLDDDLRAAFRARAIPTPARVTSDAQQLSDERRYDVPITIIACEFTGDELKTWMEAGEPTLRELAKIRDVTIVDLPTGHWPQFTRPKDLGQAIVTSLT